MGYVGVRRWRGALIEVFARVQRREAGAGRLGEGRQEGSKVGT